MNIQSFNVDGLFYAQIDELYDENDLRQIQKELVFLEAIKKESDITNTAHINGKVLKDGHGIFVDEVYLERDFSIILTKNRRLFDENICNALEKDNCFYKHLIKADFDRTLVNFYGNNGNYKAHCDSSTLTALTFFKIGTFSGGNLSFPKYNVSIEPVEGRVVIFPGCVLHQAEPIVADEGCYRVTMAQFIKYR